MPNKTRYFHNEHGQVDDIYWQHVEDHELTQLRKLFLEEMRRLQPGWVEVFESSQRQRDFDLAVSSYDIPFMLRGMLSWLSDLESGMANIMGLEERMDVVLLRRDEQVDAESP